MSDAPDKRTSILVVGTGSIGQRHARLLGERRDVDLSICDTDAECLREAKQAASRARVFADFEEALLEHPDAVFVCTPHRLHMPMAIAAFRAGCDVFCEKPLAESVENARAIVAAAQTSGRLLQVGYALRFHPGIRRIQRMVAEGQLGTLVGGRALVGTYFTLTAARRRYRVPRENALILDYTHQPDYLSLFFGQAQRASAECTTLGDLELVQEPNVFSMVLRYGSGALVQIHLDFVQYPNRHILELFGDRRTVVFDFISGELRTFSHGADDYRVERVSVGRDDVMREQIVSFLDARLGKHAPACTGADGMAALRVAEAAVRSARELRSVEVGV